MTTDFKLAAGVSPHKAEALALQHAAAAIVGRLDRLPACWTTWRPAALVSLAAIFEVYDLYYTSRPMP